MKERPILFSAPMVRAILAGAKTQTRRIVKPQPKWVYADCVPVKTEDADPKGEIRCPFGQPGDRLWVRETWAVSGLAFGMKPSRAAKIAAPSAWRYAADDTTGWSHGWKPSIHMPRAASRITLEITEVRGQRVQEISEDDARSEGVQRDAEHGSGWIDYRGWRGVEACSFAVDSFRSLWESIHGPGSWDRNDWAWALTFRRVES